MLAGIIFKKEPFFRGSDNDDQLEKIVRVLGTDDLNAYLARYNITLDPVLSDIIDEHTKKEWHRFINEDNQSLVTEEAIDLIDKMIVMDHSERISVTEALLHPYFDEVRDMINEEIM